MMNRDMEVRETENNGVTESVQMCIAPVLSVWTQQRLRPALSASLVSLYGPSWTSYQHRPTTPPLYPHINA